MISKLLALGLTVATAVIAFRVERGTPASLVLGDERLFLRGRWEIVLVGALLVALSLLAGRLRRSPRVAALALAPLAALTIWLAAPVAFQPQPAQEPYRSTEQLGGQDRQTLVVGVDALSWNRLIPLVEAGSLPNIERLMREGSWGVLHSHRSYRPSVGQEGYWSPVVWTTIATGTTVDRHGIDDFAVRGQAGKSRMAATWHRRVPAFWNVFSAFHQPVGVVGWWASWPAEQVEGVMVSSSMGLRGHRGIRRIELDNAAWLRKRRKLTYPEAFKHVVANEVGLPTGIEEWANETIYPFSRDPVLDSDEVETILSVLWQDRLYLDTALYLLRNRKLSVYTTYFEGVDVVSHRFWQYMAQPELFEGNTKLPVPRDLERASQVVDRYYAVIDGYLGQLLEAAGDDMTVIVVSDHGFRSDPEHLRLADHSPYGAILMRGDGIRRDHDLNLSLPASLGEMRDGAVSVLDVFPTLLYLHGLPVSEELDGKVLTRALGPSVLRDRPLLRIPTYGDFESSREIEVEAGDEEEYIERMKALGYIG